MSSSKNMSKFSGFKLYTCPKCKFYSKHTIFNYTYGIYKCTKCNNIHV